MSADELEDLRKRIGSAMAGADRQKVEFDYGLWGWNFGFDYAPTGYRMHGSHQQIHQQFALVPSDFTGPTDSPEFLRPFACGDLIDSFVREYLEQTGRPFFLVMTGVQRCCNCS